MGAVLLSLVALGACADADADSARKAVVVNTIVRADQSLIRARPQLVAGKYARMANGLFDFYRGTFSLFLRDAREGSSVASATEFGDGGPLVDGIGDAHPENFALLRASDGSFALEPNDFDGADRYPYLWELRRLAAGMVIASRLSNPGEPAARQAAIEAEASCARAVARGYADEMARLATGVAPPRFSSDEGVAFVADMFRRAERDAPLRREISDFTVLQNGSRKLLRGGVDPADPENVFADLPRWAIAELGPTLERYRLTLKNPPPDSFFSVLDAVREFGSGVASWPRVRLIVLVRGPTDDPSDDVLIELKEIADSGVGGWFPPGVPARTVQARIESELHTIWAREDADPLWGTSEWLGFAVQIRSESDANKNVRIKRLEKELGTAEAIEGLARALGVRIARWQSRSSVDGVRVATQIRELIAKNPTAFADEQADAAVKLANTAEQDWKLFREALLELGPTLGVPVEAEDAPSDSLAEIFGHPPAPQPISLTP